MSNISSNQVQGLMESYTAVYDSDLRNELKEERELEEELESEILENIAYVMFSGGYTSIDVLEYFANVDDQVIIEDLIALSEGTLIVESVVSEEYIEEQMQQLDEFVGAALRIGQAALKGAQYAQKTGMLGRLGGALRGAGTAATRVAQQGAKASAVVRPAIGRAASAVKSKLGGAVNKVRSIATGALNKLPGGSGGKLASAAKTAGKWALGGAALEAGMRGTGALIDKMSGKTSGAAKPTPSSGAPKPKGGAGNVNVPGKGQRYFASSDKKYYKNYNDALAAKNSRRGVTSAPAAPPASPAPSASSAPSGSGRAPSAPSAPSGGGRAPSAPSGGGRTTATATPSSTPTAERRTPTSAELRASQSARSSALGAGKSRPEAERAAVQAGIDRGTKLMGGPEGLGKIDNASIQRDLAAVNSAASSPKPTPVQPTGGRTRAQVLGQSYEYDAFDLVLEYLTTEGHVDSLDEALYVIMEMDGETIQNICEAYQKPRFNKKHYLKKLSKRGGMGMGTPDDPHGYRDPGMAKVGDEFRKSKTAAERSKQTGEPDTYRAASEAKAAANKARGAARRGES